MKSKKIKTSIDDGFQPELVKNANFDGIFEIPVLEKPREIFIPGGITPFSRRNETPTNKEIIGFFEHDVTFADVLRNPQNYIEDFRSRPAIIPPDCSLYRDAPLAVQIGNIYRKNAIGCYFQSLGVNVFPLVRWGSRDTYTKDVLPEPVAFAGIPHNSFIVVSTYGCIKTKDDKYHFEAGLAECMKIIVPQIVLVHGAMPKEIFDPYLNYAEFHHYPDWITRKKGRRNGK